jgi:hypothetical protein
MWSDLLVACLISLPALIYGAVQWVTYLTATVSLKQNDSGHGLIMGSSSLVVNTNQGNGSSPPQTALEYAEMEARD